jgi:hypothetical protein
METNKIFNYLKEFKNFPTYQLERRIDAFMLPYLANAVNKKFEIDDENLVFVYPEFPLKRLLQTDTIVSEKLDKLSEYADYVLWSPKLQTVYLVEFKTDETSLKESQFLNYYENCKMGRKSLIVYYLDKAIGNKKYWNKFVKGLLYIKDKAPALLGKQQNLDLESFLEKNKSKGIHNKLLEIKSLVEFEYEPKIKFIFLAPEKAESKLQSYISKVPECKNYYAGHFTLNDFSKYTDEPLKDLLSNI